MAGILSQGKYFIGVLRLNPTAPVFSRGDTIEIDTPFRKSASLIIHPWSLVEKAKSLALKLREYSIQIGRWEETDWDEELALQNATGWKRHPDLDEDVADWGVEDDDL